MIYMRFSFSFYQKEFDIFLIRSINDEIYLQRVLNSTLYPFDDKRCYGSNIKSKPGINVVVKEKFLKSKNNISRGKGNVKIYDRILSNQQRSNKNLSQS